MDYISSDAEHSIVKAVEGSKQVAKINSDEREELINLVVKWRLYIGIPKADVAEELVLNAQFIYENYGFLTIDEIELAIKLSVLRKLPDCEFHGYFSPMYVSKVLDSYLHYRKMTLADAIRRRDKAIAEERERQNRPTPEKQAEMTRSIFKTFYEEWKKDGAIRDVFNICYNYLRKHKMLVIDQEMLEGAQAYGKLKVKEAKEENRYGKIEFDLDMEEKRWARNYCVQKYFESVDINVLCNNIKAEHFT